MPPPRQDVNIITQTTQKCKGFLLKFQKSLHLNLKNCQNRHFLHLIVAINAKMPKNCYINTYFQNYKTLLKTSLQALLSSLF